MKKIVILIILIIFILASYLFFLRLSAIETFEPEFPKEYDKMVIKHGKKQWIIEKNERTEEFISKSTRVSEHIGEGLDFYILEFFLNNEKVYSIVYDDIGYPKKAIEVMNEIVKENGIDMLKKGVN